VINETNHRRLSLESVSSIDFRTTEVTLHDSKAGDTLTVAGFTRAQLEGEISYYVRLARWTHDKAGRDAARNFLTSLLGTCREGLEEIERAEKAAEEASA